ncbi:uncharacterized protein SPPG_05191 [Spizellomyces punctatus DAOM BR117]|uniref:NAD-dependent epimerase/dehydratase domain-containing protein n=1 Tax=Spizellomyces punctatus (strain DAOM BR117) TaxID=645134 RepID=A0A0L0HFV4_SPIPD|nr:uncharacterized protein SPPG_05191 [Spizellomyces punctatus DAOM BR117]KNC99814.1 hypothetical protein SPPG_05191 [Spizellomyces punctatus DAOM BR117]|eukprot:XP_016607854.1 hypothetical protein SPPG_05191 [Spizellomyces punctatus DAOM BR117]
MSNILVIGATGFIGLPVALALRRSGYHVYGLTRSSEKARLLARSEILPVIGEVKDLSKIVPPNIEVIIDVSAAYYDVATILEEVKTIGSGRKATDPKLSFIYTSGTWNYGTSSEYFSESTPLGRVAPPPDMIAWRPDFERKILESRDILDVAIVRPSMLYGGNGSIWSVFFDPIIRAKKAGSNIATVLGAADLKVTSIHKDDLADLYVKIVEKLPFVAATTYPVINGIATKESLGNILSAFAKEVGFSGTFEFKQPEDVLQKAIVTTSNASNDKAKALLGWYPKQEGVEQGMKSWAAAYLAWAD